MTALHLTLILCISWLAVAFAAEPTRRQTKLGDGERRQIFRDEVDHLKKVKRPAETNHGYFQPQEDGNQPLYQDSYRPDTHDNYRPTYQDNYQPPNQDVDYPSNYGDKPPYQQDYTPSYEDDYKPNYQDEERPPYEDEYKPNYQDDHKPSYQDDYKPSYEDTPLYEDDYKPIEQDNYKPTFDDAEISFFKPIDFDINFYGAGNQKPDGYDGYDQHQEQKPYVPQPPPPAQYDDYEPVKPAAPKPYKPAVPKPYKPRPTYPKEVVLLKPSLALKSNAYADKYTTPNYRPSHIPGTPGEDYPNYTAIPETSFDCLNFKNADFNYMFSDRESGCQVFHTCHDDGRQDSFLCPLGTIFDVESQTCDWWFNVRCI